MNRSALLCALLLAACGGSKPPAPVNDTLGNTTHETNIAGSAATADVKPDPAYEFRKAYQDPGGMWMPSQMTLPQHVDNFQKMGVQLDAKTLADPLQAPLAAVVWLGGCTASFVSAEGLIVTNHHCVQGALQHNSDAQHNYIEDGFLAPNKTDEPSAGPAARVMVVQAYRDVTSDMRDGLDAIKDGAARKEESEKRLKQLVATCEKDRPGIRCQVSSFFGGGFYQLFEMLEIRDVRLVYAPARRSVTTAARLTTGAGRATPATGRSIARTSARMANRPITPQTTCRISPSTGSRSRPTASSRMTS